MIESALWPRAAAEAALDELAAGFGLAAARPGAPGDRDLEARLIEHGRRLGVEVSPCRATDDRLERSLLRAAPAIVPLGEGDSAQLVVLLRRRRRRLAIAAPDGREIRVPVAALAAALRRPVEREERAALAPLAAALPGPGGERAQRALLRRRCRKRAVAPWLLVRPRRLEQDLAPVRRAGRRALSGFLVTSILHGISWVVAWWLLGTAALRGHADPHLAAAFALILASGAALRACAGWCEGRAAMCFGLGFRARAFRGVLGAAPSEVCREGVGRMMGRAMEIEAIERLAVGGGLLALTGAIDVLLAVALASVAGVGPWLPLSLVGFVAIAAAGAGRMVRALATWTDHRLELTHDLVEKLAGHRTRLIQLPPGEWSLGEDRALSSYLRASAEFDRRESALEVLAPRGFLLLGVVVSGLSLLRGTSTVSLAVSLGAVLLGWRGLATGAQGLAALAAARLAHRRAGRLMAEPAVEREPPVELSEVPAAQPLVELRGVEFCHDLRGAPAVAEATAVVRRGAHVLLRGPSGSGKSTLAGLIAGEHRARSGAVLLHGFDRGSLGLGPWRRRVALVPQFHLNHVYAETLAFNLLLGRAWPPAGVDLQAAEALLRELELGALLDRMPSGLFTRVGDSGWQLSHGERSRVFVARALLQQPELLLLDESLAALDPETLSVCMAAIRRHVDTLLIIAHP